MSTKRSMGSHQSARMKNDEWLTPHYILEELGRFDLDPCCPIRRPWETADRCVSKADNPDGLELEWYGRVWLNPPFGSQWPKWVLKLAQHGNGIALLAARTETQAFFQYVWQRATAILFLRGRPHFHYVDGTKAAANSGVPICLIAYGKHNAEVLRDSGLGHYLRIRP